MRAGRSPVPVIAASTSSSCSREISEVSADGSMTRRRLTPRLIAQRALPRRAITVEHQIVRGAHDIGQGIGNRTHRAIGQPHPQILKQILGCITRAAHLQKPDDPIPVGEQYAFDALRGVGSVVRTGHGLLALERHFLPVSAAPARAIGSPDAAVI